MTTGDLVPKKKTALQWGMANYLPSRRASEDDASIELHVEWMQQESRKKKPNYQWVGESLMATFADRRRWVVTQGALASEVGEKYPWIFKEDELLNEFQRIHGSKSITSLLDEGLVKYAGAIVALAETSKVKSSLFKEAVENMASLTDDSARKDALHQAAVLGVPTLLEEPVEHMLCQDEMDISVYMKKMEDDEYEVIVEKVTVAKAENFHTAFINYLSSFYCLNLQYTDTLKKTLKFFQWVVLGIKDNMPRGKPVINLQARLGRYISAQSDE